MEANFDAKATAVRIEDFAKRCLDDYSNHNAAQAEANEQGLAKELAAVWGSNDKMSAVSAELKKLGGKSFSGDPNVEITAADGSITGVNFTPSFWDHGATGKITSNKHDVRVDVTVKTDDKDPGLKTTAVLSHGHIELFKGHIKIDI